MSDQWRDELPFFDANELACRHCGLILLDIRFAVALPVLRYEWGAPLVPTSCCRCPTHNVDARGHPRSLHLTDNPVHPVSGAMAIDFAWRDWSDARQRAFCDLALASGWCVGLNELFVHLDRREDFGLPSTVFTYGNWVGWAPDDLI